MAKYKKKPVVIEAFRLTMITRWDNSEWPKWLHIAWNTEGEGGIWPDFDGKENLKKFADNLCIGTKEGIMRCPIGWWIIKGIVGEIYCCENDIFEQTYELVELVEDETKEGDEL